MSNPLLNNTEPSSLGRKVMSKQTEIPIEIYSFLHYWHKDVLNELEQYLESDVAVGDF